MPIISFTLTGDQFANLVRKGQPVGKTPQELLDFKLAEYLDAVARDLGRDKRAEVIRRVSNADEGTLDTLLATLTVP